MTERTNRQETIIYGGAFNPPTVAHQQILQSCVEYAESIDGDVWLLPSASRADKEIDVSVAKRIQLCKALARDVVSESVDVRVETSELIRGVQTETYDTVREFDAKYPDRYFRWVFGADSVNTMDKWHHGEWMKEHLPMLIVERQGYKVQRLGANATRLAVTPFATSSTEVRRKIANGESYRNLVSEGVEQILAN